ncbi:MAG: putative toxin-antitoxin system toxin component, PIN family [Prevotella sp.]|nr:putative toxin-antitoxin system toxin component, PIN family [Prevotella sp.]
MRRIVLDTNCLLQALPTHSPYHKIWTDVLAGEICLCVNTEILIEYEEILTEKTTREIAKNVVEAIARLHTTIYQDVYIHFSLIKADPDDNKFVDCAVAADAEYIVTNNSHFNILKKIDWPKISIITIEDFAAQIANGSKVR